MRKFVLLLGCFAASPVVAGEATLTGEAIKTTFGGSVLALDTPLGNTVSVHIGHDGLMSGEAGTALGAVLGAPKDRGRWWVAENKVCFKWFRWFDAAPRCATISLEGKRFTWRREDGDTGTGTIVEQERPVAKPPVIVAEEKKPSAHPHSPAGKMHHVVVAENAPKSEASPKASAALAVSHPKQLAATAPALKHVEDKTVAELAVPAPRPAVRPAHHRQDPILVASVKPQFFTAAKAEGTIKAQPAKVETVKALKTKVARIEAPKVSQKPFRVAGVDPNDMLNIRTGPSPEYETVGGIPPDSRGITITGPCQNDWCPVKHRTLVGWVNRRYLTEETADRKSVV